jgi:hypothetical protein
MYDECRRYELSVLCRIPVRQMLLDRSLTSQQLDLKSLARIIRGCVWKCSALKIVELQISNYRCYDENPQVARFSAIDREEPQDPPEQVD